MFIFISYIYACFSVWWLYENAAKSEIKRLNDDSDLMKNAKGDICSKILERQRKIALLENDSSTLSQVLLIWLIAFLKNGSLNYQI